MTTFNFDPTKMIFDKGNLTLNVSEVDVQFATEYKLINPKTNKSMIFKLSHSTGPELDPKHVLGICSQRWDFIRSA